MSVATELSEALEDPLSVHGASLVALSNDLPSS